MADIVEALFDGYETLGAVHTLDFLLPLAYELHGGSPDLVRREVGEPVWRAVEECLRESPGREVIAELLRGEVSRG